MDVTQKSSSGSHASAPQQRSAPPPARSAVHEAPSAPKPAGKPTRGDSLHLRTPGEPSRKASAPSAPDFEKARRHTAMQQAKQAAAQPGSSPAAQLMGAIDARTISIASSIDRDDYRSNMENGFASSSPIHQLFETVTHADLVRGMDETLGRTTSIPPIATHTSREGGQPQLSFYTTNLGPLAGRLYPPSTFQQMFQYKG